MRVGAFVLAAQFPGQGQGEALHRAVRTAEVAEEAGLDSVWLAEHHFVPYGVCPSAVTLAALMLGRTRRLRVGTAVSVLPSTHPVALGEQAALLHLTSEGRFTLGVGRGGPWVDLEVFGGGLDAYENRFPEDLDLLRRWLAEPRVGTPAGAAAGGRYGFREVAVVPRASEALHGDGTGPELIVACTSPARFGWPRSADCPCCWACTAVTRTRPPWSSCGGVRRGPRAIRPRRATYRPGSASWRTGRRTPAKRC